MTVVYAELGAVSGALYELPASIQEPVRPPVEIYAGMRAVIEVAINFITLTYDKEFNLATIFSQPETTGLLIRNFIQGTYIMQLHLCRY